MRSARLVINLIWNFLLAFGNFVLKIIINAHQLIAHWRTRTRRQEGVASGQPPDVELARKPKSAVNSSSEVCAQQQSASSNVSLDLNLNSQSQPGSLIKTPDQGRKRFVSLFRRLSIRNFMEYCVIALNEASSSGCSNKFDLSLCEGPVWLLGRLYYLPQDVDSLIEDVKTRIWITYRKNFPPIDDNTRYTTDRGFGCMIRCGQMVMANALICKNLGRDWRWSPDSLEANPDIYLKVLKLFQDKVSSPYSIHNIVQVGQQEGKEIGEWFGPNTIAQALKRLSTNFNSIEPICNETLISVDAALDNLVVKSEVKSKFRRKVPRVEEQNEPLKDEEIESGDSIKSDVPRDKEVWVPGILFIQLRLGLSKINPLYYTALRKTFQFENSLGIIGGRPNHALYLVGHLDDDVIYLDPHCTQQYIDFDVSQYSDPSTQDVTNMIPIDSTYHCTCPEKMPIDRLDPSLALCFYFHTEQDFDEWCYQSTISLIKSEQAPMFEISDSRPTSRDISIQQTNDEEFEMLD